MFLFEQQTPTCHEQRKVRDDCSNMPVKAVSGRRRGRSEVAVAWHWGRELPVRSSSSRRKRMLRQQDRIDSSATMAAGRQASWPGGFWIVYCVEREPWKVAHGTMEEVERHWRGPWESRGAMDGRDGRDGAQARAQAEVGAMENSPFPVRVSL